MISGLGNYQPGLRRNSSLLAHLATKGSALANHDPIKTIDKLIKQQRSRQQAPLAVYRDQARLNPKHHRKIYEIEDIVAKNQNLVRMESDSKSVSVESILELSERSDPRSNDSKIKIENSNGIS